MSFRTRESMELAMILQPLMRLSGKPTAPRPMVRQPEPRLLKGLRQRLPLSQQVRLTDIPVGRSHAGGYPHTPW